MTENLPETEIIFDDDAFVQEAIRRGFVVVRREPYADAVVVALRPVRIVVGATREQGDLRLGDTLRLTIPSGYVGVEIWPIADVTDTSASYEEKK